MTFLRSASGAVPYFTAMRLPMASLPHLSARGATRVKSLSEMAFSRPEIPQVAVRVFIRLSIYFFLRIFIVVFLGVCCSPNHRAGIGAPAGVFKRASGLGSYRRSLPAPSMYPALSSLSQTHDLPESFWEFLEPFANFTVGEFAPSVARRFSKKVLSRRRPFPHDHQSSFQLRIIATTNVRVCSKSS